MAGPAATRDGDVWTIDLGDNENRTSHTWLDEMDACLDRVESAKGPRALVLTATGKFFCNGLDVDWMTDHAPDVAAYVHRVEKLLARLLVFDTPTIAAVNGHAFGAGAFLVIAVDRAVMRADRGYVSWPEAHLGMTFTRGLAALADARLNRRTLHEALAGAPRYGGPDAVAAGFVDEALPIEALHSKAIELVAPLASTAGDNLASIKRSIHHSTHELLTRPPRR